MEGHSVKKLIFIVFVFSSVAYAVGPFFHHKDPVTQQEFEFTYQEIQKAKTARILTFYSYTLAQINALKPTTYGQVVACSNCTNTVVCISTGTGIGAWSSPSAKGTHCN